MHRLARLAGPAFCLALFALPPLPGCSESGCGDSLDVALPDDQEGDYVFEGVVLSMPEVSSFRCAYRIRAAAEGILRATEDGCEGRVGLHVGTVPADAAAPAIRGDTVAAYFYDAPEKVAWTLTRTAPAALTAEPETTSGTLDPDYEGDEGCTHAEESLPD